MKQTLLLLCTLITVMATGQKLIVSAGAEKTVHGIQYNGTLLAESKKFWGAGVFYQAEINRKTGESTLKNPFYGVATQVPIARSERILFAGVLRAGLVNDRFFVVVPSVETRIALTSRLGTCIGAGLRHGHPSLSARIFAKIF